MNIKHLVEKEDGSVTFQGVLSGAELAFVVECGLDAIIAAGGIPFASLDHYSIADLHDVPDLEQ